MGFAAQPNSPPARNVYSDVKLKKALPALCDRLEQLNVQRIQALIELAKLRHQTLPELMNSLGIDPSPEILDYA